MCITVSAQLRWKGITLGKVVSKAENMNREYLLTNGDTQKNSAHTCGYIQILPTYIHVQIGVYNQTLFLWIYEYITSLSVHTHLIYSWFQASIRSWNISHTDRQTTIYVLFIHIVHILVTYIAFCVLPTDCHIWSTFKESNCHILGDNEQFSPLGVSG